MVLNTAKAKKIAIATKQQLHRLDFKEKEIMFIKMEEPLTTQIIMNFLALCLMRVCGGLHTDMICNKTSYWIE